MRGFGLSLSIASIECGGLFGMVVHSSSGRSWRVVSSLSAVFRVSSPRLLWACFNVGARSSSIVSCGVPISSAFSTVCSFLGHCYCRLEKVFRK